MSLLDDVSIVVTPNGYKAGTLFGAIPVPTFGSDEITNGGFATDSDWSKGGGWSIGGGVATANGNANSNISQNIPLTVGNAYSVTYTVVNSSVGSRIGIAPQGTTIQIIRTADGTYTETFTAATSSFYIRSLWNNGSPVSVDNVSVKEWVGADMDVTRATAATRVDENGLVNYAEIIGSEEVTNGDFATDTDWTKGTGWTISGGTANFIPSGSFINLTQSGILTSGKNYTVVYTLSNVTAGNVRARLGTQDGGSASSDGTYTSIITANGADFSIRTNGTFNGSVDNVSIKEVTRDNVPRIDYTGGGCPHILAEPQRRNLITYSEDLTNAFYQSTNIETVTESAIVSPDGTSFGYTIVPTSATSSHYFDYVYTSVAVSSGVDVTYSIFVKPNGHNFIQIATSTGFASKFQNFELTGDGVIGTGDVDGKTIEKIGDYYKISVTQISTGTNPRFLLIPSPTALATRNASFTGNGTDGVLGWGVQIEVGSYPTSYIPNFGTALGVTRNQDIFTRDGIGSLINSTEGVLFAEMAALADDLTGRSISLNDGTYTNTVILRYLDLSNQIQGVVRIGGSFKGICTHTLSDSTISIKVAYKWKDSDFALWINGSEVATSSDVGAFSTDTINKLSFDKGDDTQDFYGKVKQLQVYDTALTDVQLAALTS